MKTFLDTFCVLILFIFTACDLSAQYSFDSGKISTRVNKLADKLAKENELLSEAVGIAGIRPEQYDMYVKLKNTATAEELKELTNHYNGVVRGYALWGLADRQEHGLLEILINHLTDSATIQVQFGCGVSYQRVGDFYISMLVKKGISSGDYFRPNYSRLNEEEIKILDSAAIFTDNRLEYTEKVIRTLQPEERYYSRLKELAQKGISYAVISLAKYRNEEDISLIYTLKKPDNDKSLEDFFEAVSNFPHKKFWSDIEEYNDSVFANKKIKAYAGSFYLAAAAFRSPRALQVLRYPLDNKTATIYLAKPADYISMALEKIHDSIYIPLALELTFDYKRINAEGLYFLYKQRPDTIIEFIKNLVWDEELFDSYTYTGEYSYPEEGRALKKMIDILAEADRQYAIDFLAFKIKAKWKHDKDILLIKAVELKDEKLVNALLEHAEKQSAYDLDAVAQALLMMEGRSISDRFLASTSRNKELITERLEHKYGKYALKWAEKRVFPSAYMD
jgi:hypothetical protein